MSDTARCSLDGGRRTELAVGFAADALEPDSLTLFTEHLAAGCPACEAECARANGLLAGIVASVATVAPPARAWTRLLNRIEAERMEASGNRRGAGRWRWAGYAVAAAIGAGLAALGLQYGVAMPKAMELAEARRELASRDVESARMDHMLGSERLRLVSLKAGKGASPAGGRILWDRERGQWNVYIFDLAPPPAGRTYELWFITPDQRKIAGPTFGVDASGKAVVVANVPDGLERIALAAITDEPMGGVSAPTGAVRLLGEVPAGN